MKELTGLFKPHLPFADQLGYEPPARPAGREPFYYLCEIPRVRQFREAVSHKSEAAEQTSLGRKPFPEWIRVPGEESLQPIEQTGNLPARLRFPDALFARRAHTALHLDRLFSRRARGSGTWRHQRHSCRPAALTFARVCPSGHHPAGGRLLLEWSVHLRPLPVSLPGGSGGGAGGGSASAGGFRSRGSGSRLRAAARLSLSISESVLRGGPVRPRSARKPPPSDTLEEAGQLVDRIGFLSPVGQSQEQIPDLSSRPPARLSRTEACLRP